MDACYASAPSSPVGEGQEGRRRPASRRTPLIYWTSLGRAPPASIPYSPALARATGGRQYRRGRTTAPVPAHPVSRPWEVDAAQPTRLPLGAGSSNARQCLLQKTNLHRGCALAPKSRAVDGSPACQKGRGGGGDPVPRVPPSRVQLLPPPPLPFLSSPPLHVAQTAWRLGRAGGLHNARSTKRHPMGGRLFALDASSVRLRPSRSPRPSMRRVGWLARGPIGPGLLPVDDCTMADSWAACVHALSPASRGPARPGGVLIISTL